MNAAWQIFGSVSEQFQETVVGTENISRQISEDDGDEIGGDQTPQGCIYFGFHTVVENSLEIRRGESWASGLFVNPSIRLPQIAQIVTEKSA